MHRYSEISARNDKFLSFHPHGQFFTKNFSQGAKRGCFHAHQVQAWLLRPDASTHSGIRLDHQGGRIRSVIGIGGGERLRRGEASIGITGLGENIGERYQITQQPEKEDGQLGQYPGEQQDEASTTRVFQHGQIVLDRGE